jgi:MFS family permease
VGSTRFVAAVLAGRASDRWSRRVVLVPSLLCCAAGSAFLVLDGLAAWLAAIAVLGCGSSSISVGAAALTDRVSAESLGRQLGAYRLSGDCGMLAGPIVVAYLYDHSGTGAAVVVTVVASLLCALVAWLLLAEGSRRWEARFRSDHSRRSNPRSRH